MNTSGKTSARLTPGGDAGAGARVAVQEYVLERISRGEWTVGQRLPTDEQLAEQFAVSRSTVSQAMQQLERDGFLQRFRRRGTFVAKVPATTASEALNQINPTRGRVHIVAPLSPAHASMHWNRGTLDQLETALNAAGLQLAHHSMPDTPPPGEFRQFVEGLARDHSRALVILLDLDPHRAASPEGETALIPYIHALRNYSGKVCWLNRVGVPLNAWPHDAVSFSPMNEGMVVGQYLVEQGVSQVICFGRKEKSWSRMRQVGLELALKEVPQPIEIHTRWLGEDLDDPSDQPFQRLLDDISRKNDRPTVVVPTDHYAVRLLDLARERGIRCPEAFCLMSFDNDERYREYNITTVAPPAGYLGEVIGQLICDQVRRPSNAAIHITLKSVIVERSTFTSGTT